LYAYRDLPAALRIEEAKALKIERGSIGYAYVAGFGDGEYASNVMKGMNSAIQLRTFLSGLMRNRRHFQKEKASVLCYKPQVRARTREGYCQRMQRRLDKYQVLQAGRIECSVARMHCEPRSIQFIELSRLRFFSAFGDNRTFRGNAN
jgi:hypothetical protein